MYPSASSTSLSAAAYEDPDGECPICGGKVRPRDLLQAHVDHCLTQMERKESQQQLKAPSPGSTGSSGGSTTPRGQATTTPQSAASSSAKPTTPPAARADSQQTKASAGGSSGGGLRGLFSRSRRVASVNVDIKNEYKQLRKAIMETSLALCTKREAVQLAALAMRLDIAHEECRTKKPKEELDLYKREKQKPSLGQYYSPHWLNVSEPSELAAELLSELEQLEESLAGKTAQEVQTGLMTDYVAQCQALPFYGMTVFSVLEWRVKDSGGSSKGKGKGKESAPRGSAAAEDSSTATAGDDGDNAQNDKKADKKEKKTKTKKEKQAKVKYEKVPVSLGITRECSLIKIDERNEVEMAWRITQIKSYSLMLREGREKKRAAHMPSPYDFIMTLDFGHFFPHYLQLLNRQPKGLLGKTPRQRLRENAMIRLADESEDAIRLIYVQIHSYIQQASGRAREERRRMEERLALYGLRERDVVGDGNCQMRAISYQLFQTEDKHIEIRKAIVKWLQNNANYAVRETSTGRVISRLIDFLETDYHRTWSDYCSYMSKDKSWGDHMTLLAAAEIYSVNIWILSSVDITNEQGEASEPWSTIEPHLSTAQRMIRLAHWHEKHFSALAPAS